MLDICGRGEIPASIKLGGGPERVLTVAAFDVAGTGIQIRPGHENHSLPRTGATAAGIGSADARRRVRPARTAHSSSGNSPANAPAIRSQGSASSWRP